jgi:hypothetical protein
MKASTIARRARARKAEVIRRRTEAVGRLAAAAARHRSNGKHGLAEVFEELHASAVVLLAEVTP